MVEWWQHSRQAGTPRKAAKPLSLLVDVPAALWECWAPRHWWTYQRRRVNAGPKGFDTRAGTSAGQPTRELVGGETVVCVRYPRGIFFNAASAHEQVSQELYMVSACMAWLDFDCAVSEVVASVALLFFYSLSFSSLLAFRSSARSMSLLASGVSFTSAYLGRLLVEASTSITRTMARCVDARRR